MKLVVNRSAVRPVRCHGRRSTPQGSGSVQMAPRLLRLCPWPPVGLQSVCRRSWARQRHQRHHGQVGSTALGPGSGAAVALDCTPDAQAGPQCILVLAGATSGTTAGAGVRAADGVRRDAGTPLVAGVQPMALHCRRCAACYVANCPPLHALPCPAWPGLALQPRAQGWTSLAALAASAGRSTTPSVVRWWPQLGVAAGRAAGWGAGGGPGLAGLAALCPRLLAHVPLAGCLKLQCLGLGAKEAGAGALVSCPQHPRLVAAGAGSLVVIL